MKTRIQVRTALAVFSAAAALAGTASGQTTTWYYGASNNSATYGVTPTTSQAITWQDGWAGGTNFDQAHFGEDSLQVNRPDATGIEQSIMMFGFSGTGLSASNVSAATLYLREDFSAFAGLANGSSNTWNIVGIAAGNSGWDNSGMTWNDINGATSGDWTGGTLGGSLSGSYGSFSVASTNTDTNIPIDITLALKAYLNGTISGIAFVNSTNGDTFASTDYEFVSYSNDNATATNLPGLLVTAVPEPTSASLGLIGAVGLLIRRRR